MVRDDVSSRSNDKIIGAVINQINLKKSIYKVTDKSNPITIDITGIEWVLEVKKISFFLAVKIKWQKNNSNFHLEF